MAEVSNDFTNALQATSIITTLVVFKHFIFHLHHKYLSEDDKAAPAAMGDDLLGLLIGKRNKQCARALYSSLLLFR